tara:strand:+ start:706 stop:1038 length:333 start_codon:yes stop_codon:yes gene_type:complete
MSNEIDIIFRNSKKRKRVIKSGRPKGWRKYDMDNVMLFIIRLKKEIKKNDYIFFREIDLRNAFFHNHNFSLWATSTPLPIPIMNILKEHGFMVSKSERGEIIIKNKKGFR